MDLVPIFRPKICFMRILICLLFCLHTTLSFGQKDFKSIVEENENYRSKLNHEFASEKDSPLTPEDRAHFDSLPFFSIDSAFYVVAHFEKVKKAKKFKMKTTTERRPLYDVFALVSFSLNGQTFEVPVYQSHRLREMEEFKSYLFLPFTDLTNGNESYGGGRFLDLEIPEGEEIIIDFNKAYNPYCAYNSKYSCPVPPKKNFIDFEIKAGVKAPANH